MGVPKSQRGPFVPMRFEATIEDCLVTEGEIPEGLHGGFYRNGPTWRRPARQGSETAYTMDGMVQGLVFREGRVEFRNRWVRTPKFLAEERAGRALFEWSDAGFGDWRAWGLGDVVRDEYTNGVPQGTNGINAVPFAGDVLALAEQGGPPIALDPITLETRGVVSWSGKLPAGLHEPACFGDGALGPHPKWDITTNELVGCSYRDRVPYVTVTIVRPDGSVRNRHLDDAPYNAVMHDLWLTEQYVILAFTPFVQDRARIARGLSVYGWDTSLPVTLALLRRDDLDGPVRWMEADFEAEYVMHTLSANEIEGTVVLDGPIFDRPPFMFEDQFDFGGEYVPFWKVSTSTIGRWTVDLDKDRVTTERLGDQPMELPKIDERFWGRPYEWGFLIAGEQSGEGMRMNSVVRRNVRTGKEDSYTVTNAKRIGVYETVFAPRTLDAPEGDGWLIAPVAYFAEGHSAFLIFDTESLAAGPIARIELPFLMGWTPHGHWMDFR